MTAVKIAYYRKEDWNKLLEIIDDKESMHETWNQWFNLFTKTKEDLMSKGFIVVDIEIDLDELNNYCNMKRIKNNGEARSQFVQQK